MSAIPSDIRLEADPVGDDEPRGRGLPRSASVYGVSIGIAAFAAALPFLMRLGTSNQSKWTTFGVLAAGAAASHTYTVRTAPRHGVPHVLGLPESRP